MDRLRVDSVEIEYEVRGLGEPVLLIHPSLMVDGLVLPLLAQPDFASHYRVIHYYRRGYLGSSLGSEPLTIPREASDAAGLLRHLEVPNAHIVGHSMGGLIALQLAVDAPELVRSLALLEPPIRWVPSGKAAFEKANLPMLNAYRSGNKRQALEMFGDNVFGPNWQDVVERSIPGSAEQALNHMDTFIQEQPAIQAWQFGPEQAALIRQPVLSVVGTRSNRMMKEGRDLLHSWLPQTEDFDPQSNHLLQIQDPTGVAHALMEFWSRHGR